MVFSLQTGSTPPMEKGGFTICANWSATFWCPASVHWKFFAIKFVFTADQKQYQFISICFEDQGLYDLSNRTVDGLLRLCSSTSAFWHTLNPKFRAKRPNNSFHPFITFCNEILAPKQANILNSCWIVYVVTRIYRLRLIRNSLRNLKIIPMRSC